MTDRYVVVNFLLSLPDRLSGFFSVKPLSVSPSLENTATASMIAVST